MHCVKHLGLSSLTPLLARYQLKTQQVFASQDIPHSFWGAPEAGRLQSQLFVREDTPIHSVLHEACHYICMPKQLRLNDCIDVGGKAIEENACCYLQIILADHIPNMSRYILMHDMDEWGYSFRLGSTARWFYADCDDTRNWLIEHQLITKDNNPTWALST